VSIWNSTGISTKFIQELQDYCIIDSTIERILLFGSRARGDFQKTSDIDLAIFTNSLSHTQQNLIAQKIYEMQTPLKIDVLFVNRISKEKLISNIYKEGVVIYEKGAALREA
jgi:uncharacterized protein